MTDGDYYAWADYHAAAFGLSSELVARMFAAWRDVFQVAGYRVDELHEATRHIAAYCPPRFLSDHLPAIRTRISERRLQEARENMVATSVDESCNICHDTGWALVPMLSAVVDGQWTCLSGMSLPISAVTCRCLRGSRLHQVWRSAGDAAKFKPMALVDYEAKVPHWFDLLTRREKLSRAESAARAAAVEAQKSLPELVGSVAGSMKPNPGVKTHATTHHRPRQPR